jgi:uncharacterized protein (DUF433 family)
MVTPVVVRKVPQREVLQDIRSGMDETAICKKYNLSVKGLNNLYDLLIAAKLLGPEFKPVPRKLSISDFIADIGAGMSKDDLMKKYGLSEDMLRLASRKILAKRGKNIPDYGPETLIEDMPGLLATREFVRHEVDFELPIYELSRPDVHGLVRDVSEEGIGVSGIRADIGDVKTLVVLGDDFGQFSSFEFEGYCRWCYTDPADGTSLTGFGINKISKGDLRQLQKLVLVVTTGG